MAGIDAVTNRAGIPCRMRFRSVVIAILPTVAGCTIDCLHVATGVFAGSTYGTFVVTVRDGMTGQSLVSGSTLVVRGSAWADSVTYESVPPTVTSISLSEDQLPTGTYAVEVRHPGYQTWTYGGISILYSSCGLARPVYLTADLTVE